MAKTRFADMECSVARTLDVVGERWSLLILRDAFYGVRRFDDFQRNLGIARNVLTDRLTKLVGQGVLERQPYQDRPPRYEYRLTEKGRDLLPVVLAMMRWGDRWTAGESGPPVTLTHTGCGASTEPHVVCSVCGEELRLGSIRTHGTLTHAGSPR
jgi:DNA-binding HxlR family transcriptional regulator